MCIGVNEICKRLIFCLNVLTSVYFKGTLKDIIFATTIIIFYDVSSFQSAEFGDVNCKTQENKALLKIKISGEQKQYRPHWPLLREAWKYTLCFLIPLDMLHSLLILVFWNLIFGKHILSCWLYQYLRSRWYGSHEIFLKNYRIIFCSHTRPGRPASIFCFLQFW